MCGSGATTRGVPLGHDAYTHEPVGLNVTDWLRDGHITNTALWLQAQPGVGKSAIAKRLGTGLCALGWTMMVPADIKGEYTPLVRRLGGTVITVGPGHEAINPLDPGPLRAVLAREPVGTRRDALRESIRTRQAALLEALLAIELSRPPSTTERAILSRALDIASDSDPHGQPTIPDVRAVLALPSQPMLDAARVGKVRAYFDLIREALCALDLLVDGPLRGHFDRRTTAGFDPDTPAISLDISALNTGPDSVVSAAMLCSWAWGASLIESRRAGDGRNLLWVQDEAWRALRAGPGLVERGDRMTRTGRHEGIASLNITHSMLDLQALPTAEDRAKAAGIASRSAIHIYGGMAATELDSLAIPLSTRESNLITSWQGSGTWVPGQQHPGRGRLLLKTGQHIGLPVRMRLTPRERELFNTDTAFTGPQAAS
ncbi:ATPase [Allokutzneria multivorans]|uniref:ATPase n=1 Tax=Allokutzneria multivorans TaxID=1142134 RepID=A0ABP7SC61_9PSEU